MESINIQFSQKIVIRLKSYVDLTLRLVATSMKTQQYNFTLNSCTPIINILIETACFEQY